MYIRHRISISDIRHCIRYVEVNTYNVVCAMYYVVCWRTTLYITYDVARTMSYVYTLYIVRTTSYVRCSTRCRTSHVQCRTCMTYDIVRDVRHSRWQESRWLALPVLHAVVILPVITVHDLPLILTWFRFSHPRRFWVEYSFPSYLFRVRVLPCNLIA